MSKAKDKADKKRGQQIANKRAIGRIKKSQEARAHKKAVAREKPVKPPVLLRHETENGGKSGGGDAKGGTSKPRRDSAFTDRMDVDDFMEHGFLKAMEAEESGEESGEEAEVHLGTIAAAWSIDRARRREGAACSLAASSYR